MDSIYLSSDQPRLRLASGLMFMLPLPISCWKRTTFST